MGKFWFLLVFLLLVGLPGCYGLRGSSGGGETSFLPPRLVQPADVALPDGYIIEAVAAELTFPTGVAFDNEGGVYVVESGYSYGEAWATPRLLQIGPDGRRQIIAAGSKGGPWTGVFFSQGEFFVAEGSQLSGGRILRITSDGTITSLADNLPSLGDHHTNGPVIGPDGWVYFGQGTATNAAVVGEDNAEFGWLKRHPEFHDVACRDLVLTGENFTTTNPLQPAMRLEAVTGAFAPFGTPTKPGQTIRGRVPCSGAIMRVPSAGGDIELVAWGLRNPFGLSFAPDGHLYVTDNSYDVRGSRPVFGAGDLLWRIEPGQWYGWPDFHGRHRLDEGDRFRAPRHEAPRRLLAEYPGEPPEPVAILGVHASANGFDFSRQESFGYVGDAFIAEFGDMVPGTGKTLAPVGFKIVRVELKDGVVHDFAVNKGQQQGPASKMGGGGLERPVAARFDPTGAALYIVDFGVMLHDGERPMPRERTGVLWRIYRED